MNKYLLLPVVTFLAADLSFAQTNLSVADAIGTNNHAIVKQTGNDHSSTIYQNGTNPAGQKNLANVQQEDLNGHFSNESTISQFGVRHESMVTQKGNNAAFVQIGEASLSNSANTTYAEQNGNLNEAFQLISGGNATGNEFEIRQYRLGNNGEQIGIDARNSHASGLQTGEYNVLKQPVEGAESELNILQVGDWNAAFQSVEGYFSEQNSGSISQYGDHNYSAVKITGSQNSFTSAQYGNFNTVSGSEAVVSNPAATQQGDQNLIRTAQFGNNNTMELNQTGNQNEIIGTDPFLDATQSGNYNHLEVNQTGFGNTSKSSQLQNNNAGDIKQNGQLHQSTLLQNGHNNAATVIQNN